MPGAILACEELRQQGSEGLGRYVVALPLQDAVLSVREGLRERLRRGAHPIPASPACDAERWRCDGASALRYDGLDVFDLALHSIRRGVPAIAPPSAVVVVHGEILRQSLS